MHRLLPVLMIVALAGCDRLLESSFPKEQRVFEADGQAYAVATQYDPLEFAFFNQISTPNGGPLLTGTEGETVKAVLQDQLGPELCEGRKMALAEFNRDNLPGGGNMFFMPGRGMFQVVTRCQQDVPDFFPETPEWPELPTEDDLPTLDEMLPSVSLL